MTIRPDLAAPGANSLALPSVHIDGAAVRYRLHGLVPEHADCSAPQTRCGVDPAAVDGPSPARITGQITCGHSQEVLQALAQALVFLWTPTSFAAPRTVRAGLSISTV